MTSAGGMARAGRVKEKKKRRENRTRLIRRMRKAPFYGPQPSKCFGRRSRADLRSRCCLQLQRLRAAGPSLPRPLSPQGRGGRKTKESFFFTPSSPRGRGGVGEVRGGGAATLKKKATAGSAAMASSAIRPGRGRRRGGRWAAGDRPRSGERRGPVRLRAASRSSRR